MDARLSSEVILGQCLEARAVGNYFHRVLVHMAKVAYGIDALLLVRAVTAHVAEEVVACIQYAYGFVVVVRCFVAESELLSYVVFESLYKVVLFVDHRLGFCMWTGCLKYIGNNHQLHYSRGDMAYSNLMAV